ncbi:hypothetical protein P0082_00925 [Candidatus Haliotispira prima]|uniref:Uncharacterized protein n=1 Tax=Candidatus Haliotispira prima TaxID=3034016 RepID=A0ABY8MHN2_9SPIO|nr:hypothetical protein P0082_00925 [Candidatus Haliotispira prima]
MKYYIGIKGDKVVANWGGATPLSDEQISAICEGMPDELREVPSGAAIPLDHPLVCYKTDWTLKTAEELEAEGLDENGSTLPTAAEREAEKQAEEYRKQQIADLEKKQERLMRFVEFNKTYEDTMLKPIAETLARKVYNGSDPVLKQNRKLRKLMQGKLTKLRAQNKTTLDQAKERLAKYREQLDLVDAQLNTLKEMPETANP